MTTPAHLAAMTEFKMNDMHPLHGGAEDIALNCLDQAHALALMLEGAFRDSEETSSTNRFIVASAFDGIATLIALAQFAQWGGEAA